MLDEPRINVTGKTMMEADLLAMEKLHNAVTAKPKVLSLHTYNLLQVIELKRKSYVHHYLSLIKENMKTFYGKRM